MPHRITLLNIRRDGLRDCLEQINLPVYFARVSLGQRDAAKKLRGCINMSSLKPFDTLEIGIIRRDYEDWSR